MLNIPTWLMTDDEIKMLVYRWRLVIEQGADIEKDELDALQKLMDYGINFRGIEF